MLSVRGVRVDCDDDADDSEISEVLCAGVYSVAYS